MTTVKLQKKLDEVFWLEPSNLGPSFLTHIYKGMTGPLKRMPFMILIPLSIVASVLIYIVLGQLLVNIVSLLQNGF